MLHTFTRFPQLPLELRIQIWQQAAIQYGRVVEVRWTSESSFTLCSYPPALLSVSTESRKHTYPLFGTSEIRRPNPRNSFGDAYSAFDYENDVLYFPYPSLCVTSHSLSIAHFFRLVPKADLARLRHIAISMPAPEDLSLQGSRGLAPETLEAIGNRFTHFQEVARQYCRLDLNTLALVFGDPLIQTSVQSVARDLNELEMEARDLESLRSFCMARLAEPVFPQTARGLVLRGSPRNNWGKPRIDVRSADRRYGDPHMVNWIPK